MKPRVVKLATKPATPETGELVRTLRGALKQVDAGDVVGFALVALHEDGHVTIGRSIRDDASRYMMLAGLYQAANDLHAFVRQEREPADG